MAAPRGPKAQTRTSAAAWAATPPAPGCGGERRGGEGHPSMHGSGGKGARLELRFVRCAARTRHRRGAVVRGPRRGPGAPPAAELSDVQRSSPQQAAQTSFFPLRSRPHGTHAALVVGARAGTTADSIENEQRETRRVDGGHSSARSRPRATARARRGSDRQRAQTPSHTRRQSAEGTTHARDLLRSRGQPWAATPERGSDMLAPCTVSTSAILADREAQGTGGRPPRVWVALLHRVAHSRGGT